MKQLETDHRGNQGQEGAGIKAQDFEGRPDARQKKQARTS